MLRIRSRAGRSVVLLVSLMAVLAGGLGASPAAAEPPIPAGTSSLMRVDTVTPQVLTTVKIGSRTAVVEGVRVKLPVITVRGPRAAVAKAIEVMAAAEVRAGIRRYADLHTPVKGEPRSGGYGMTARVVANASPVLAIVFTERTMYAADGIATRFRSLVVDTATGRRWTTSSMVAAIDAEARPGVDVIGEIRRGLGVDGQISHIGVDNVTLAPTPAGLYVLLDKCTIVCVAGPLGWRIPWSRLLPPGTRLPLAPWV